MSDTDRHTVTYEQAAQILGVSVRTVQRRVRGGQLATVSDNGRQLVVLPDSAFPESPSSFDESPVSSSGERSSTGANIRSEEQQYAALAALEARVAELEADRDMWRTMAARLSDTVTEQNRMLAVQMVQQQRMIAAETPASVPIDRKDIQTPPRRRRSLRDLYRAWRGR